MANANAANSTQVSVAKTTKVANGRTVVNPVPQPEKEDPKEPTPATPPTPPPRNESASTPTTHTASLSIQIAPKGSEPQAGSGTASGPRPEDQDPMSSPVVPPRPSADVLVLQLFSTLSLFSRNCRCCMICPKMEDTLVLACLDTFGRARLTPLLLPQLRLHTPSMVQPTLATRHTVFHFLLAGLAVCSL